MNKKLDWRQFINFWKQYYDEGKHPDKKFYDPCINNLSRDDFLDRLWRWKMGFHLDSGSNKKKLELMNKNKEVIRKFRRGKPTFKELHNFSRETFKSGVVYQVFLMHICKHNEYPIFDQNVFRSFIFLTTGKIIEVPQDIQDYLDYRKFVFKIHKRYKINFRDIDKALMVFGQFLNNRQKFLK